MFMALEDDIVLQCKRNEGKMSEALRFLLFYYFHEYRKGRPKPKPEPTKAFCM